MKRAVSVNFMCNALPTPTVSFVEYTVLLCYMVTILATAEPLIPLQQGFQFCVNNGLLVFSRVRAPHPAYADTGHLD